MVLIVLALCVHSARAQQKSSTPKADDAAEKALREKAYDLLETLAGQLGTMQSPENRARIGSNLAGSLWTHDETRARELFAAVQQDINVGLQVAEPEDREDVETLKVFMRLRSDTINRILKYDPELAYEFFKATALNPDLKVSDEVKMGEQAVETQLAKQVAAANPELALRLARKILSRGYSDELRKIFRQLNRKHKEQATALYKGIVEKLGEADFTQDWNAKYFAMNFVSIAPPEIDEASFNELISVFIKIATENGCHRKLAEDDPRNETCTGLAPFMTLITKFSPSRGAQFSRWKVETEYQYWQSSPSSEIEDVALDGTVEEVLALVAKYPQQEAEIRLRAFGKARYDGDFELARKIANESSEADGKQQMLAELATVEGATSLTEEALAQLQKNFAEIKQADQQVIFLASAANYLGPNDRPAAIKLLNQARQITDTMRPGRDQIGLQLGLAMLYCYHKNDRGFAIMQSLLPKLNELVEASAKLDGIERRYLRDGEWNMTGDGVVGSMLNALADNAGYFARCDFDRAVSMASQFERTEIRIMAQLKLAQGVLAGPLKPLPLGYGHRGGTIE